MYPLLSQVLAVAGIFYIWRFYVYWHQHRARAIRERVAYLVWVAAQHVR